MQKPGVFTKESRKNVPPRGKGKLNKTVKDTVLSVFKDLQEDPKHNLTAFAKKYPRDFYAIAAKLIPQEIKGDVKTKIQLEIVRGKANTA